MNMPGATYPEVHADMPAGPALTVWRVLLGLLLFAVAVGLGWKAWEINTAEACRLKEWPKLPSCVYLEEMPREEQARVLQERLARNPGDALTLVKLTELAHLPGGVPGLDAPALLQAAIKMAPQHGNILRLQADDALKKRQWAGAIDPLVRLTKYHGDAWATESLARLIANMGFRMGLYGALADAVEKDNDWLGPVLSQLPAQKTSMAVAMPLVSKVMDAGRLKPELAQLLMRQLKSEGLWLEAHSVWLNVWNRPLGLVFNGDFERPFIRDGFDWEVTDLNAVRAGARVYQVGRGERGQVLQVLFTGRAMAQPVLQQHLLLVPGKYRLSADFHAMDLRSQKGVAWTVACAATGKELARTEAINGPARSWKQLKVVFEVPADCGLGLTLALRTFAEYEARVGMRGELLFDRFELVQAE